MRPSIVRLPSDAVASFLVLESEKFVSTESLLVIGTVCGSCRAPDLLVILRLHVSVDILDLVAVFVHSSKVFIDAPLCSPLYSSLCIAASLFLTELL